MIFDCDGVLVDSEVIAYRVFAECLNEAGIVRSVNEAMAFGVGKSARILAAAVEKEFGRSPRENFVETFRARVKAAFTRELKAVEGIIELLAALKLNWSPQQPHRRTSCPYTTGLLPHFAPHIYSATMVARSKPAPDLFLHAAEAHGIRPERCLVIKDRLSGVVAA